jgi:hypothetical protein
LSPRFGAAALALVAIASPGAFADEPAAVEGGADAGTPFAFRDGDAAHPAETGAADPAKMDALAKALRALAAAMVRVEGRPRRALWAAWDSVPRSPDGSLGDLGALFDAFARARVARLRRPLAGARAALRAVLIDRKSGGLDILMPEARAGAAGPQPRPRGGNLNEVPFFHDADWALLVFEMIHRD